MLTRQFIRSIQPTGGKLRFVADGAVGGLGILYGARGRPSWTLAYRVNGKQIRQKLGFAWGGPGDPPAPGWLTVEEARIKAYQIKAGAPVVTAASLAGRDLQGVTMEEAVRRYLRDENVARLRTAGEIDRVLHRECAPLLKRKVAAITRSDIRALFEAKGATHMANRFHSYLTTFFTWCVDHDLVATSPVPSTRPLKRETRRDRWLTDEELRQVLIATESRPANKAAIVRLLILTGQRREEVAGMRWCEVDLDAATWTLPPERAKNESGHIIPLSPVTLDIIRRQPQRGEYVFTNDGRRPVDMSIEGGELRKLTPFKDWRIHDLRRTFATGCQRLGVDTKIVDRALNHVTVKGAGSRYLLHEFLAERRECMETWSAHVASLPLF